VNFRDTDPRTGARMASSAASEAPNDAASRKNAVGAPSFTTTRPPSAGPMSRVAIGRTS
jgi:hypothetical protein